MKYIVSFQKVLYYYVEVKAMDGYQRRTEKKKENIRNAAFELFKVYGVEKVSIAEIAKKATSPLLPYIIISEIKMNFLKRFCLSI